MKNRLTKDQATFFLSGLGPCTSAVARAAMDNGVARFPVTDRDQYRLGPDERLSKHIKKIGEMEGF